MSRVFPDPSAIVRVELGSGSGSMWHDRVAWGGMCGLVRMQESLGGRSLLVNADGAAPVVSFQDTTCDEAQKIVINNALTDALSLARSATNETFFGPLIGTAADRIEFLEYFGPRALPHVPDIVDVFAKVLGSNWQIQASCDAENQTLACQTPLLFGGIFSTSTSDPLAPTVVYCKEFLRQPPMDPYIRRRRDDYLDLKDRFQFERYAGNQGAAMLQTLLHHITPPKSLNRTIEDRWLLLHSDNSTAKQWYAYYHVTCAKILARFDDDAQCWSAVNAYNYVAFALTRHILKSEYLASSWPWIPMLGTDDPNYHVGTVAPFQTTNSVRIVAGLLFTDQEYRYIKFTDDADLLSLNDSRKAQLDSAPYLFGDDKYGEGYVLGRTKLRSDLTSAKAVDWINYGAQSLSDCYANFTAGLRPSGSAAFPRNSTLKLAAQYCNETIRPRLAPANYFTGPYLSSFVQAGLFSDMQVAISKSYYVEEGDVHVTFNLTLDWERGEDMALPYQVLDGKTLDDKVQSCIGYFSQVASAVR
ncbi:hypothetical protein K491DRAFT_689774 [Lophiostoma macrostomum CBS 122681]|uniref:Uncharacterized protein n=1 Tax=Lophiostoma macrostomum CBS 122681 TaxID=1314788 RepID=A0A6A6TGT8_9PLEO|nr:hypothetical protein K491DRAFT_689774 [Lophiostoma macrostomum CBS 122681]